MRILSKHQKKGIEGFMKYVTFLESTAPEKVKEIISAGVLEDPVYLKWVMANMINFDYVMTLEEDDISMLAKSINNPIKTFVYAFYKNKNEDTFINNKLGDKLQREYKDEREYTSEVKLSQQGTSQRIILETIRRLQREMNIQKYEWKIPDDKILTGHNYAITADEYEMDYDDGTPALRGSVERKLRTGEWQHFYPNGCLMAKGTYVDDEREGMWVFYYAVGKMKATGIFTESLKDGEWVEYDIDGNATTAIYNRGRKQN